MEICLTIISMFFLSVDFMVKLSSFLGWLSVIVVNT